MSIEFRTRIPSAIEYKELLNYGICCRGVTLIDANEYNYNYLGCYATGGYFIPGTIEQQGITCPNDHK